MTHTMRPIERYCAHLTEPGFQPDPAQQAAADNLDALYQEILSRPQGMLSRLLQLVTGERKASARGLYIWGGVGRGKTMLMDLFYESLPFEEKRRIHFHRFMHGVHQQLKSRAGQKNPLQSIAESEASRLRVLCFDEFFVTDIADAMILGSLLEALLTRGVALVATSNIPPDELYRDGLQRQRFLPAIDLLKRCCKVINVDGGIDYRLRILTQAELYHWPLGEPSEAGLMKSFKRLAPEPGIADQMIEIDGRHFPARFVADDVAWFEFSVLCEGPRSQYDYLEVAREYHAVLLGNVKQLDATRDDAARRFVNLVDVFYDRNVKLVISCEVPLHQLYTGQRLSFEFARTRSRLLEMQSHEYLARPHRP